LESSAAELDHPEQSFDLFQLAFLNRICRLFRLCPERAQGYLDESRSQPFTPQELNEVRFSLGERTNPKSLIPVIRK